MRPGPSASKDNRPLAFFGDVHGNLPALEAVLKDLDRDGIHRIHVAGDLVFGGEQPLEVWRLLEARKAVCVRGASDTALATLSPEVLASRSEEDKARVAEFLETRAKLGRPDP
jgi:predicted phosphodiesterase